MIKLKKNKAFTLVELLGVIAIIGVLLAFVSPSIIGMMKRDSEKEYNRFLKDLYLATESYITSNIDDYESLSTPGGTYTIKLQELVESGYVKTSTVNPKTEQKINLEDTILITKESDGTYSYQYQANQ